jgi:hypothetical protein
MHEDPSQRDARLCAHAQYKPDLDIFAIEPSIDETMEPKVSVIRDDCEEFMDRKYYRENNFRMERFVNESDQKYAHIPFMFQENRAPLRVLTDAEWYGSAFDKGLTPLSKG